MLRGNFIRRISSDHSEWGEDRIALELRAKLGVDHASSTIRRYMAPGSERGAPPEPPGGPSWPAAG